MFEKEFITQANAEKISVTTRRTSDSGERILISLSGKTGKYIIDLQSNLTEEEALLLSKTLQEAVNYIRKSND